jgi:hypothetical protein
MSDRFNESAVAQMIGMIARMDPRSICAEIKPEAFDAVVKRTAAMLADGPRDLEIGLIIALGKLKAQTHSYFRTRYVSASQRAQREAFKKAGYSFHPHD